MVMARSSRDHARNRRAKRRAAEAELRRRAAPPTPGNTSTSTAHRLVDHDSPTLQMAMALWERRQYDQSLELYEQAVQEEPHNLRALVNAARSLGARYELEKAERLLHRLLALGGGHPVVQYLAGESYHLIQRPALARRCYERTCELTTDLPEARLALADAYERSHRLEEAWALIDSILPLAARLPEIRLTQARILRRQGQGDQAEHTLREVCQSSVLPRELRCRAWAELASLLDERGEYDAAVEAIEHCKRDQRSRDAAERHAAEHVMGRFEKLVESVTAEDFDRWHEQGAAVSPRKVALLAGFPRSGTTLLEQVLDTHPGVVSSEERDILAQEIFPSLGRGMSIHAPVREVLDRLTPQRIEAERTRYLRMMEQLLGEPVGDRIHLDKNPALTLMLPAIVRLFPEMKLIIALRDPRDVVISCFLRYLPLNPVSFWFLTLEGTARRYALDMRGWLKYRGMIHAPWMEVRYEDMVADLPAEARRAIAFLGLPWDESVLHYRQRASAKPVLSPTYADVTKPVYGKAVGRWKHYEAHLAPVFETLAPFVSAFGYE